MQESLQTFVLARVTSSCVLEIGAAKRCTGSGRPRALIAKSRALGASTSSRQASPSPSFGEEEGLKTADGGRKTPVPS